MKFVFWPKKKVTKASEWLASIRAQKKIERSCPALLIRGTCRAQFMEHSESIHISNIQSFTIADAIKLAWWILDTCE